MHFCILKSRLNIFHGTGLWLQRNYDVQLILFETTSHCVASSRTSVIQAFLGNLVSTVNLHRYSEQRAAFSAGTLITLRSL